MYGYPGVTPPGPRSLHFRGKRPIPRLPELASSCARPAAALRDQCRKAPEEGCVEAVELLREHSDESEGEDDEAPVDPHPSEPAKRSHLRSSLKNELNHLQTVRASFSAVSKPIFAST